jgi:hypothetical protein
MNASRIVAFATGALLLGFSLLLISGVSVPVPRHRTGTYADYLLAAKMILALHGGVFLGVVVYWVNRQRVGKKMNPMGIFKAGFIAELCISVAFTLVLAIHGLIAFGSMEKGVGNLWGAVIIFWLILGALVAAAVALLFYGFSGRRTVS